MPPWGRRSLTRIENKAAPAYRYSDPFEKRRTLMDSWARYLSRCFQQRTLALTLEPEVAQPPWSTSASQRACPCRLW